MCHLDPHPVYDRKQERTRAPSVRCWLTLMAERVNLETWHNPHLEFEKMHLGHVVGPRGTLLK
jgi:hypothetical protein